MLKENGVAVVEEERLSHSRAILSKDEQDDMTRWQLYSLEDTRRLTAVRTSLLNLKDWNSLPIPASLKLDFCWRWLAYERITSEKWSS